MTFSPLRKRPALLRGAVAAGALCAAAGALVPTTASAVPVSVTLNYMCTFPLIKPEPLKLKITSDIPASIPLNTNTGAFDISATAEVSAGSAYGLSAVETKTIEGTALAAATVTLPGGFNLPLQVPTTIAKTTLPSSGAFTTAATGQTPSLSFAQAGNVRIAVGDLVLSLTPRLADGTLTGLDSFETECTQNPGQDNTLATIAAGGTTPTPTTQPTPTPTTQPTPSPTPNPGTVDYNYALAGSATMRTLTQGSIPLTGGIAARLTLATGDFTAGLALNPATAKLTTLGFLPVVAKVAFVSTAPTTGTLKGGVLTSNSKVRIKLPQVSLFGIQLAGGSGCQAKSVSNIALKSTDAFFDPLKGGTLAGRFAISDLTNCGFLTGLVSPLTAGSGNPIVLKLTPTA